MLEPARLFLTHPFGVTVIAWAALAAGILAGWLNGRKSAWSRKRLIFTAATPTPLVIMVASAAIFLIAPWDDPLVTAMLLTVGLLGTIFSLIVGVLAAWLVTAGLRQ